MEIGAPLVMVFFVMLLLAAWAATSVIRGHSSKKWPRAKGTILRTEIFENKTRKAGSTWIPKVAYSFQYNGETYQGSNITFSTSAQTRPSKVEKILLPYAVGSEHDVYVNPKKPELSVLVPGLSVFPVIALIASSCTLFFLVFELFT